MCTTAIAGQDGPAGAQRTVPFFEVLPVDLQVAVLQTWIADPDHESTLLRALSALDVACSNHSLQPPLRALLAHPGIVWAECDAGAQLRDVKADVTPSDIAGFMFWLHSRGVGVRWLCVSGRKACSSSAALQSMRGTLSLPSVTALVIAEAVPDGSLLSDLLSACPSLAHIRSLALLNRRDLSDDDWAIISTLQLKSFVVRSKARATVKRLISVLKASGSSLRELRISEASYGTTLFRAILAHCKLLQVLEVDVADAIAFEAFVNLLRGLTYLEDLALRSNTMEGVDTILVACPTDLKRFSIKAIDPDDEVHAEAADMEYEIFVGILEGVAQLDFVEVEDNCYDLNANRLVLSSAHDKAREIALLMRIMLLRLPVQQLTVNLSNIASEGAKHGLLDVSDIAPLLERLHGLTLTCLHADQCIAVLTACSSLIKLSINVPNSTLDAIFLSLPASCTHHVQELCIGDMIGCTEDAVEMALSKCPQLALIKVEAGRNAARINFDALAMRMLEAMARHKIPLKLFVFPEQVGLHNKATFLEGFRTLARERQLIPVPRIQVEAVPSWCNLSTLHATFVFNWL